MTPHPVILAPSSRLHPAETTEGAEIQRNKGHNLVVITGADDEGDTARSSGLPGTSRAMTEFLNPDGVLDSWHHTTGAGRSGLFIKNRLGLFTSVTSAKCS